MASLAANGTDACPTTHCYLGARLERPSPLMSLLAGAQCHISTQPARVPRDLGLAQMSIRGRFRPSPHDPAVRQKQLLTHQRFRLT